MNCFASDRWIRTTLAGSFVLLWAATALAQQPNWNVEVASGVATTTGDISNRLTKGYAIDFGAGYEINRTFELDGHFTFNGLGVSDQALQALQMPNGNIAPSTRTSIEALDYSPVSTAGAVGAF